MLRGTEHSFSRGVASPFFLLAVLSTAPLVFARNVSASYISFGSYANTGSPRHCTTPTCSSIGTIYQTFRRPDLLLLEPVHLVLLVEIEIGCVRDTAWCAIWTTRT